MVFSDILQQALGLGAARAAADEATQKTKQEFQIDDATLKSLRERLFRETEELYQKTCDTVHDSPNVAEYCLDMLRKARLNLLSSDRAGDLSDAEYYVQKVRSKLSRSEDPVPLAEIPHVRWIWIYQMVVFVLCIPLAVLPFVASAGLALFGNAVTSNLVELMAAAGWGGIGGVVGTLYNLPWFVQMREYDPAYNLDYVARPIKGFIVGGIMMLIFTAGITSAAGPVNTTQASGLAFAVVYLIAALGGFKQEYVFELFDNILKVIFRQPPTLPKQIDPNSNLNRPKS
ncbi:MAG: hypothetical protein LC737_08395 [Chloroflexi bacterium]|nr:hypothetical protein [Chloroflexota bacterium]